MIMKSSKLFAAAALFGVMSFALPICTRAQDNSISKGASEMYHGAKQDVKDTAITTKVKAALDTDKTTAHQVIHVDTVNGVVTLTGEVPSMTISQRAQEVAQNTSGVKAVRNELQVKSAAMQ
jgi:osmotically-inducible protein OsmY